MRFEGILTGVSSTDSVSAEKGTFRRIFAFETDTFVTIVPGPAKHKKTFEKHYFLYASTDVAKTKLCYTKEKGKERERSVWAL